MKKTLAALLALITVTIACFPSRVPAKAADTPAFSCDGVSALTVAFPASGITVLGKDEMAQLPVAGMTRMAAMLLVSEAVDSGTFSLDTAVTVSAAAARVTGATAFIEANEVISARELYKSAAMIGAGDAVYALCEAVFGSMDVCLTKINERMSALGASCSYSAPLGDGMQMTADDVTKIACALANSKTFLSFSNIYMDTITHAHNKKETQLVNPNRLIRDLVGCTGLATGSSNEAGYCGAFSVTRSKNTFVCVVLGAKNSAERFMMAKTAIEFAFASYKTVPIAQSGEVVFEKTPITGAVTRFVDLIALTGLTLLCGQADEMPRAVHNLPDTLLAPLNAGEIIGTVDYFDAQGNRLGTLEVGVKEDVEAVAFSDYVALIARAWN